MFVWWLVCAISSFRPEITPREKTKRRQAKRRNNVTRKDEKTKSSTRKDDELTVLNGVFSRGVFSSFRVGISTFRVAGFVISSFRVALFRLFVFSHGVISSFRLFAWRLFVFSFFRVALFRGEKTKRRNGTNQPPYVWYMVLEQTTASETKMSRDMTKPTK